MFAPVLWATRDGFSDRSQLESKTKRSRKQRERKGREGRVSDRWNCARLVISRECTTHQSRAQLQRYRDLLSSTTVKMEPSPSRRPSYFRILLWPSPLTFAKVKGPLTEQMLYKFTINSFFQDTGAASITLSSCSGSAFLSLFSYALLWGLYFAMLFASGKTTAEYLQVFYVSFDYSASILLICIFVANFVYFRTPATS